MIELNQIKVKTETAKNGDILVHAELTFHHAVHLPAGSPPEMIANAKQKAKAGLIAYIAQQAKEIS